MQKVREKWLIFRLKARKDPEAFAELYDHYVPRIYRFVYFKVSAVPDAEDITAQVFLKAWEYLNEHREIENFGGLLYRIARNLIIDFYRSKAPKEGPLEEDFLTKLPDPRDLIADLEIASDASFIMKSLQKMKNEYREVLTLRYIDELTISEIAEILNKSKINVRVLIHRSLKVLRKILDFRSRSVAEDGVRGNS